MAYQIRKAAVLGAGVMGAAIAAHLANVGIPSLLLDIVPADAGSDRSKIARTGLEKTLKSRPAAFYNSKSARLVTVGNIEDDLEKLAEVDWVIEAVVERLDIKNALYTRLEKVLQPNTIISSNTSGLPAHMLVEGRSEQFKRNFLITHFFNPVRYMRLLELVPTIDTDPELMRFMQEFSTEVLGKGVVLAKDTPNFIANRVGVYGFLSTIQRALKEGYTIAEVDTILGPNMGRPKSAVFRTADLSGIDTTTHVADNLYENAPNDEKRETFQMPDVIREMLKRNMLGEKSGQGFYKRVKNPDGSSAILALNFQTLEYEPQEKVRFASIGEARTISDPVQRMYAILRGDDRASIFARETLADSILYAGNRIPEIADTVVAVDEAMRWGFNFDMGSFEVWDALLQEPELLQKVLQDSDTWQKTNAPAEIYSGLQEFAEAHKSRLPQVVYRVITEGEGRFYKGTPGQRQYFDFEQGKYLPVPAPAGVISLAAATSNNKAVRDNGSASLIDLGDGVACIEFHTKMNAIDEGIIEMLNYVIQEGPKQYRALVIGNEAQDFSAGANLLLMLMGARQGEWKMLEGAINALQQAHQMMKFSPIPVVAAPAGRALGGGCEVIMHTSHARAYAESYIGLVEVGAGLVPAGGGCKELLLRLGAGIETQKAGKTGGPFTPVRRAFETISFATVSTSAAEAQSLGFLRKSDAITVNREVLLRDAKADALKLAEAKEAGKWQPAQPTMLVLPGVGARMVLEQQIEGLLLTQKISEHDAVIGGHLAKVLTGGEHSFVNPATEQDILDLEREAFLSLCGMEKTQDRMQSLLMTGKPLRN
jgi:3-hydroxyacyl-CoA dehydrogenase